MFALKSLLDCTRCLNHPPTPNSNAILLLNDRECINGHFLQEEEVKCPSAHLTVPNYNHLNTSCAGHPCHSNQVQLEERCKNICIQHKKHEENRTVMSCYQLLNNIIISRSKLTHKSFRFCSCRNIGNDVTHMQKVCGGGGGD